MNRQSKKLASIPKLSETFGVVLLVLGVMAIVPTVPSRWDIHKLQLQRARDEHAIAYGRATVICLSPDGQIWFGRDSVKSLSELQMRLSKRLNALPADERGVYLKASSGLHYGDVVKVTDAIAAIGVIPINFVTKHL
jgi:biopolymer transport protein ExbD